MHTNPNELPLSQQKGAVFLIDNIIYQTARISYFRVSCEEWIFVNRVFVIDNINFFILGGVLGTFIAAFLTHDISTARQKPGKEDF